LIQLAVAHKANVYVVPGYAIAAIIMSSKSTYSVIDSQRYEEYCLLGAVHSENLPCTAFGRHMSYAQIIRQGSREGSFEARGRGRRGEKREVG
jgi:hypothetical protein